jgi:hypothetical protein
VSKLLKDNQEPSQEPLSLGNSLAVGPTIDPIRNVLLVAVASLVIFKVVHVTSPIMLALMVNTTHAWCQPPQGEAKIFNPPAYFSWHGGRIPKPRQASGFFLVLISISIDLCCNWFDPISSAGANFAKMHLSIKP